MFAEHIYLRVRIRETVFSLLARRAVQGRREAVNVKETLYKREKERGGRATSL